ncbi:MAG: YafY family transcriptional regulator [Hyphomicrobiales bacterium]|nr:YafY family transcriptional regulator [Hyphomicrobiales bacterium]MCP5001986.1 YafY family transcriptional regulator [Hyphomicrobiales bacterium]
MARSTRMLDIIQILRNASRPMTAQEVADVLEVTKRTIYRDIASLQSIRVPIEGEAGIGYIMRPGLDLPPINFDTEEAEAITVGLAMIARTGDRGLKQAAARVARKLSDATALSESLFSSTWGPEEPQTVDLSKIRSAIRSEVKIEISYRDSDGQISTRHIRPIAVIYHSEAIVVAAWCELRNDFRHFRPDRILDYTILSDSFALEAQLLRENWKKDYAEQL